MISYINIKNIALIQELSLELKHGLNILSGETGAGKSIIIDSINFVLGDRADRSLIRYGENSARVEVVFDDIDNFEQLKEIFIELGLECDETVIVTRVMSADKSECRVNGRIVTLSTLRRIVGLLVDVHSQNEHQSLLKVANHIKLLDAYNSNINAVLCKYQETYAEYNNICSALDNFSSKEERERELDILQYQVEEIQRVKWQEGEDEHLNSTRNRFYNSQKITSSMDEASKYLDGYNGFGGISSLKQSLFSLRAAAKYDDSLSELTERLDSSIIEISDISETLADKLSENELETINIEEIEARLEEIRLIKKKYGKTVEEVNSFCENAKQKIDNILSAEDEITALSDKKSVLEHSITAIAKELHTNRAQIAKRFSKEIQNNLQELGMSNSVFDVKIDFPEENYIFNSLNSNGADIVEFMLSPNKGEPLKPLAKIASGGEMSRFMLALKNVIAELDNIDTLIFDEIDTGISGIIAKVVACKLYDIAKTRQVIAITHLPQLASMADINFLIEKKVVDEKTLTFVKELTGEDIYSEVMRLSGAVENSIVGREGAIESKNWANAYKTAKNKH